MRFLFAVVGLAALSGCAATNTARPPFGKADSSASASSGRASVADRPRDSWFRKAFTLGHPWGKAPEPKATAAVPPAAAVPEVRASFVGRTESDLVLPAGADD